MTVYALHGLRPLRAGMIRRHGVALFGGALPALGVFESLRTPADEFDRLGTGYIDLLLLHQQFGDYMGAWKDMERAVKDGRVRSIGLSNFGSDRLEQVLGAAEIKPSVLQVECHPYYPQRELRKRIAPYGTVIECWYPLGHGDKGLLGDPTIVALAEKYGKSPAQIILRWGHSGG